MASPLAGAWLFFLFVLCCISYRSDEPKTVLSHALIMWLLMLGMSTFILAPVVNGAATMWVLAALPILALSLNKDTLYPCIDAALGILIIYACGIILQMLLRVRFTEYNYSGYAWPMLDPNNAAAVLNVGLISSFYMALRKPKWLLPFGIFCIAMIATMSKAGMSVSVLAVMALTVEKFGEFFAWPFIMILLMAAPLVGHYILPAFVDRIIIWKASLPLLTIYPFSGTGLGSFGYYYNQVRAETSSSGFFAHNDMLQFGIEGGIFMALAFGLLVWTVIATTTRKNIVSALVFLGVCLQSMVEFQFYVPAVSILSGVALAHHRLNSRA